MFNIVLLEPEIPANTGNIGRTCLVTGSALHLIEPMGFIINDKNLKRAGMDYWHDLDVTVYDSWRDFVLKNKENIDFPKEILDSVREGLHSDDESGSQAKEKATLWMATTKAFKTHSQAEFRNGDYIMFGKESAGIPEEILLESPQTCIRIPMAENQRSLNLSNSAAVVLYEALRQNDYPGLELTGRLHRHNW